MLFGSIDNQLDCLLKPELSRTLMSVVEIAIQQCASIDDYFEALFSSGLFRRAIASVLSENVFSVLEIDPLGKHGRHVAVYEHPCKSSARKSRFTTTVCAHPRCQSGHCLKIAEKLGRTEGTHYSRHTYDTVR